MMESKKTHEIKKDPQIKSNESICGIYINLLYKSIDMSAMYLESVNHGDVV